MKLTVKNMYKNKKTWLVIGILSLLCLIIFKNYLNLKYAYYFWDISGDGYYCGYPIICGFADYIATHCIPSWSFKMGMGQNIFPFVLRDPFDIIFYITGASKIVYLTIYVEVFKIILSGFLFYRYLKLLNFSFYTSLAGCILFSFCGFITEGSAWFIFTFEAFNFALFLLAFELLFTRGKWQLFPFAIFLFCISMPFNLYLYGVFMIFYTIFRHLQTGAFSFKKLGALYAKMAGLTLLGVLLSGPFFLQNVWLLLHSPRGAVSSTYRNAFSASPVFQVSDKPQLGSAIFRFFSNDILGSGSNFKGWNNILGAPLFYCGLLCLLILPQVFTFLDKRLKVLFALFLAIWILPVIFPFFRYAFWLFTGDYYRAYGFFIAFIVLFYALHALDNIYQKQKINLITLTITLIILLTILFFPPFIDKSIIDTMVRNFVAGMLIVYFIILTVSVRIKNTGLIYLLLFIAILTEMGYSGWLTANRRDAFLMRFLNNDKVLYNSYSKDAIDYLKERDKSFYRVDKNFDPPTARFTDLNGSQKQGYNSTASYSSFNQLNYIGYLQTMGVVDKSKETDSRWAIGLLGNPVLESQNNVRYFLGVKNFHPEWKKQWDSVTTIGDVTVYKNNCVLPFGHTYNSFVSVSSFNKASQQQKKSIILQSIIVDDKDVNKMDGLPEYKLKNTDDSELTFNTYSKAIQEQKSDSLAISNFEETKFSGTISVNENRLMYISIPFDDGWHLSVDGKTTEKIIVNGGMTGVYLKKGTHSIEMFYKLRFIYEGILMLVLGVISWMVVLRKNKAVK